MNQAPLPDLAKIELMEYVLVFRDDNSPKEHELSAVSDHQARGLMEEQYPAFAWKLYRINLGGQRSCIWDHGAVDRDPGVTEQSPGTP